MYAFKEKLKTSSSLKPYIFYFVEASSAPQHRSCRSSPWNPNYNGENINISSETMRLWLIYLVCLVVLYINHANQLSHVGAHLSCTWGSIARIDLKLEKL